MSSDIPKLQAPVKVSAVAKEMGWEYERTLRWLHTVNSQVHGMLLVSKPGVKKPSYLVYRSMLKKVAPDLFDTARSVEEQLEEQAEELAILRRGIEQMARALAEVRRKVA